MKYFLVLAVAGLAASQLAAAAPSSEKADCSDETLDDLGAAQGITLLNDKYKPPLNADDFTKRCAEMTKAVSSLRKYNKDCYGALTNQVFGAILKTRSAHVDSICKASPAQRSELLDAVKCMSDHASEKTRDAEKRAILMSQVILDKNIADEKLRTRYACCGVHDTKALFLNALTEKCSQHSKVFSDYVDSYVSEAMGLICPEADKLECSKLDNLMAKVSTNDTKYKFFMTPMLKVVKSLDH